MDVDVAQATGEQRQRAITTLTLAFAADPFVRWFYPEPSQYLTHFPAALEAFAGASFGVDGTWRLGDFAAVAMWLPSGVEPDGDATVDLFRETVDPATFDDLLEVFDQMDEAHPSAPHWYLALLGVDAAVQGRGLGSLLMKPCLDLVDEEHLPAYLDSTNPRNVPFYRRHGFVETGQRQAGASPPITSMLREAR